MRSAQHGKNLLLTYWIGVALIVAAYAAIYRIYPFADLINDWILNVLYMIAVFVPAVVSSAVLKFYEVGESPRRIWIYITIGLWVWSAAELTWIIYNMTVGDVPTVSLADPLYLAGYFFLILAIVVQYKIMNWKSTFSIAVAVTLLWAILIVAALIVFILTTPLTDKEARFLDYLGIFLAYFYSVADLEIFVAALLIVRAFRSGALGKPWWGFVILFVSDYFYAWLIQTDAYAYDTSGGDLLRFASDLAYILAYLLIAYGFLRQYLLLRFGPPESEGRFTR